MSTLQQIYYDPKLGLASESALYRAARKQGLPVTHKQVEQFLNQQETSQVFYPSTVNNGLLMIFSTVCLNPYPLPNHLH